MGWQYRIIAALLIGAPLAVFNFIGIQNNSVSEFLILFIRYKTHPNEIKKTDIFVQFTTENQSEHTEGSSKQKQKEKMEVEKNEN